MDEPFSGLDPVNAKLFQDALLDYISEDKIIIFSSHQMSYVEAFCDDIAIIDHGSIILSGNLETIKEQEGRDRYRISIDGQHFDQFLVDEGVAYTNQGENYLLELEGDQALDRFLKAVIQSDFRLQEFGPYQPSLQELFIMKVGERDD